jgi:hypothetical protein
VPLHGRNGLILLTASIPSEEEFNKSPEFFIPEKGKSGVFASNEPHLKQRNYVMIAVLVNVLHECWS